MKYYLVKETMKATEHNNRTEGREHTVYIGKEGKTGETIEDFKSFSWMIGWKQKRFAKQYIESDVENREFFRRMHERHCEKYNKEVEPIYWTYEYEIVEYEINESDEDAINYNDVMAVLPKAVEAFK